jgi:hypothetical protein
VFFAKPTRAVLRLFGAKPLTVLRAVPPRAPYIYRDIGALGLVCAARERRSRADPRRAEAGWHGPLLKKLRKHEAG